MEIKRLSYIDSLKGFAIFLVVLGHVYEHCFSFQGGILYKLIYSFHMPLFFFMSGYLAFKIDYEKINKILWKKTIQLLVPYIVWAFIINGLFLSKEVLYDNYHAGYWFLLVLYEIFLIFYLTRILIDKIKIKNCYIKVSVEILSWVSVQIALLFFCRFFFQNDFIHYGLSYGFVVQYFPYFIVGYFVRKYSKECLFDKNVYLPSFFTLLWIFFILLCEKKIYEMTIWSNCSAIFAIASCFCVFRKNHAIKYLEWLQILGKKALDIYVFHYVFLFNASAIGIYLLQSNGGWFPENLFIELLGGIIISCGIILVALGVSTIVRQNKFLSLLLLGNIWRKE